MSSAVLLRPDVSTLIFRVYEGPVHPEFFDIAARYSTASATGGWKAWFWLCREGHVLQFESRGRTVSEVLTARDRELPESRVRLSRFPQVSRTERLTVAGIQYSSSVQIERADAAIFPRLQEEHLVDSGRVPIAHRFLPTAGLAVNRLAAAPLSYMRLEPLPDGLLVHSYHTFPENRAVVKVQTLLEP